MGVILGAFGAHALRPHLSPEGLATFETGVRYQLYHALALLIVGLVHAHAPGRLLRLATTAFALGTVLFSGSIYALVLLKTQGGVGLPGLGILTPIGGTALIAGWLLFLTAVGKRSLGRTAV